MAQAVEREGGVGDRFWQAQKHGDQNRQLGIRDTIMSTGIRSTIFFDGGSEALFGYRPNVGWVGGLRVL